MANPHEVMKPLTAVIVVSLVMGLTACQRASKEDAASSTRPERNEPLATPTGTQPSGKWPVPETMMVHMRNLEQDVKALETSPEKDHADLATKIDGHTRQVIATCSMEGDSHDALHEWLMPFLRLNKEYAAATDGADKAAKFREIQDSLAAFHERFE
jgi:hypothetical protein